MTFFRYDNAIKNLVMLLSVNRFVTHIFQPLMNRQRILIGQQGEDLISVSPQIPLHSQLFFLFLCQIFQY